ncbi:MAG: sigma factor-like helix-turn-helix DNA-binding protein [Patescibacteria group bacterium]
MASIFNTFEKSVAKLLNELPPRARSIVKRRYGLGEPEPMTLEAIGGKEGITRERVRQIESDAMKKLRKSEVYTTLATFAVAITNMVNRLGGLVSEEALLVAPEFSAVKDKRSILFFLDLASSVIRRKEDDAFYARWQTKETPAGKIEAALNVFTNQLAQSEETLKESELHEQLTVQLRKAGFENIQTPVLASYIGISKVIGKNTFGEYGHMDSPFVRPRGMRESAYVALARVGQPLHFREIAQRIGEFSARPVHTQTVHNELIKDSRFVLVGRGLYALRDWGYEPGFIKDVLKRLLSERGAMTREAILAEVSKKRQVKPSTVLINLQNKKLFKSAGDGTYTLIS